VQDPVSSGSDLFFGLATAFGYGTGDFLARQASHRIGHLRVLFFMESIGMALLVPVAWVAEGAGWRESPAWALLAALGLLSLVASFFLYRSFEFGVLSVVSPLASSYPAVTAGLAILFLGERPGAFALAGIAAALLGILLLSRSRSHPGNPPPRNPRVGLLSAFVAFAGYGVFYFALDYVVQDLGPITAAAFVRTTGVITLLLLSSFGAMRISAPPSDLWRPLLAIGVLDSAAFLAYNVGISVGSVAIVGTLSGLFSAVTVGLAALVLRERLTRVQLLGLLSIFAGVALIAFR